MLKVITVMNVRLVIGTSNPETVVNSVIAIPTALLVKIATSRLDSVNAGRESLAGLATSAHQDISNSPKTVAEVS